MDQLQLVSGSQYILPTGLRSAVTRGLKRINLDGEGECA